MFEPNSRYYLLEEATYVTPDGREIRYKRRRFLPQGEGLPVAHDVTTGETDRLDRLAVEHLGDPLLFWHICDANNALDPAELLAEYGRKLHIPIPQFEEPR
jgi:hypothetical protein